MLQREEGIIHQDTIRVIDAVQNNLKHISVEIPKHAITVVTSVPGSWKSSLVLDTIAAQSRQEPNETFPSLAQRYLLKCLPANVSRKSKFTTMVQDLFR